MTKQDLFRQLTDLTLQLQNDPDNAELLMQRGQIRYRLNDKQGAWEDLQRALELKPELMKIINGKIKK
ncbi:MAG: hypothetical protein J5593_06030 [Bacteroidaceae bacterium]|nr:hypothetical protein [Bacteroidaceae bacterium]